MKLSLPDRSKPARGHVLLLCMIMLSISLITATAIYLYSATNEKQNQRNNDYYLAVAAAEAATEKVLATVTTDFRNWGAGYVLTRLDTYRSTVPTAAEAPEWDNFDFMDLSGQEARVEVRYTPASTFQPWGGQNGTLRAFKDQMRILANAEPKSSLDGVVGSVYQDVEFDRIPIFQYAIFYNITLEFTPLPDMVVTGPVHCNTNIYLFPTGTLTFNGDLTSSGTICECMNPISPLSASGGGAITYNGADMSGVSTLSLPIGTNNSPAAVHQVLELPPGTLPLGSEDPLSSLGLQRYYNKADLIITVSNSSISVQSGRWNSFATSLASNEVSLFVSTNASFFNKRENKTVKPIQIDVARLNLWNATNSSIRPTLPLHDVRVLYVLDRRTLSAANESGVRLINGTNLPPQGLTVATPSPVYILGDYNVSPLAKGTTNTTATRPASIASDAITILSGAWRDTNSNATLASGSRNAADTTVNAAFLTGIVETSGTSDSGGVENFPRFLEEWTGRTLTYNGSMVAMYFSQIATGAWVGIGAAPSGNDSYMPPIRNWGLDQNFQYSDRLPPATPSLVVLVRANWRTPAAYTTNVMAGF